MVSLTTSTNPVEIDGIKKEHIMVIFARELTRPYSTCRVTGTTCRPNVRKWSIDAVPMWVIVLGWIVAMVGITVIRMTW